MLLDASGSMHRIVLEAQERSGGTGWRSSVGT